MDPVIPTQSPVPEKAILVFRSNIMSKASAQKVIDHLRQLREIHEIGIDLDDWENILRVECDPHLAAEDIETQIKQLGFTCSALED